MTTKVTVKKRAFNKLFYKYLDKFTPVEIFYGGAGSGKSHYVAQRFILRMLKYPGYNIMCIRKVSAANHDSTFSLLRQIINQWKMGEVFKINESKGDESITCINGSCAIFKGMKDEKEREKIKSVTFPQGILNHIWVEESSEITEQDFNQLALRLRGKSKYEKQITMTFNPIRKTHWIKKRFFDREVEDVLILKSTYKDNKFLAKADKARIEDMKNTDYLYYQIYALGEWGEVGNVVFSKYKIRKIEYPDYKIKGKRYKLTADDYYDRIAQGIDFGYEHPSVFVRIGYKDGVPHWFSEVCETHMTNTEFIDFLEKKYKREGCLTQVKKRKTIADSADPDKIKEFRNRGWNVHPSKKGKGSVRYGIDYLRGVDMVIDASCVRFGEEVTAFRNKQDKDGQLIDGEYVEEFDDAIAASRYATEEIWSRSRVKAGKVGAAKFGF